MEQLHEVFDRYVRGRDMALAYDDGLRRWSYTYDQLRGAAERFADWLADSGLRPGDRVAIWSENRPEWVAAFWGCVLNAVVVIPIDPRASATLAQRIIAAGQPRLVLTGEAIGATDGVRGCGVRRLRDLEWPSMARASRGASPARLTAPHRAAVDAATIAEIVFTSGTTGDPKGVLITHGNILANIRAIEPEARRYGPYLFPLRPLRFLNLLPLSHMFGQALAMFLPPLVRAAAVFVRGYNPDDIIQQVRRHHITLVVTVPRMLEMLRDRMRARVPHGANPPAEGSLPRRLWRFREARRLFWWRFCGFVVGGAQLDPALEEFWRRLGFAVIQGYGLTETAPMATWNHPFKIRHGTVGKPLEGIQIRIAPDGEILVRGPAVTSGYLNAPEATQAALEGGWLHTGDLGALDDAGHLVIRGRKKDVIVTPDGLKVVPEDVERVLEQLPGVHESAVVGRRVDGVEQVHAVLVLEPHAVAAEVVRQANLTLEPYQRIRGFSLWPGAALPRTEAIRKLKRYDIRRWLEAGAPVPVQPVRAGDAIDDLVARYAGDRRIGADTTFDELGLSSLDRIELMTALEDRTDVALSEAAMSGVRTIGDLRSVVAQAVGGAPVRETIAFPRWNRAPLVRLVRNLSLATWILPPTRVFMSLTIEGRQSLDGLRGPVIFAANHQSLFDVPAVLRALPRRWRRAIAPPVWKEFFEPHFHPDRFGVVARGVNGLLYVLAAFFFNAFPLPQIEPGVRETLRYIGDLVSDGFSILIFPEGERTDRGEIKRFQPGVGLIASRLRLPVVPIRLVGLDHVLHRTWRWPRRGPVRVIVGTPLALEGDDYAGLARRLEEAVRTLGSTPQSSSPAVA